MSGIVKTGRRAGFDRLVKFSSTIIEMNVVVCVKQIPDPADPGALDPSTKTLKRDMKLILDESDS